MESVRNTSQDILPLNKHHSKPGNYDIYPVYGLADGVIFKSLSSLAEMLPDRGTIIIDGFPGIQFEQIIKEIKKSFRLEHRELPRFINIEDALLSKADIDLAVINNLTDTKTNAHLFDYDSSYGIYPVKVEVTSDAVVVDSNMVKVLS